MGTLGKAASFSMQFHLRLIASVEKIPLAALWMVLYIAQTLTASTYMDTYCVAKKNSGR